MFAKALVSIATVSAFLGVFSQSALPTSPAQLTPCILNCTQFGLAKSTCTSILDFQCLCTSPDFQAATGQCLNTTCDATDIQTANGLQAVECANFTNGGSASTTGPTAAPTSTTTGKSLAPTTSPATTQTTPAGTNTNTSPPPSNAAGLAHQFTFGLSHVVGLTSAFAGVLAGLTILL